MRANPWALMVVGCVTGCLGAEEDLDHTAARTEVSPNEALVGRWRGSGPIREAVILPCWLELRFADQGRIAGNYVATVELSGSTGVLALEQVMNVEGPIAARRSTVQNDAWLIHVVGGAGQEAQRLTVVDTVSGTFGEVSTLERVPATLDVQPAQRWCSGAVPSNTRHVATGRPIYVPKGWQDTSTELAASYTAAGEGGVETSLALSACVASLSSSSSGGLYGAFASYGGATGILDLEVEPTAAPWPGGGRSPRSQRWAYQRIDSGIDVAYFAPDGGGAVTRRAFSSIARAPGSRCTSTSP